MKPTELGVGFGFIVGNLFGAILAETVIEAAVGGVIAVGVAFGIIRLAERVGVVDKYNGL